MASQFQIEDNILTIFQPAGAEDLTATILQCVSSLKGEATVEFSKQDEIVLYTIDKQRSSFDFHQLIMLLKLALIHRVVPEVTCEFE